LLQNNFSRLIITPRPRYNVNFVDNDIELQRTNASFSELELASSAGRRFPKKIERLRVLFYRSRMCFLSPNEPHQSAEYTCNFTVIIWFY